jgi:cell division protein FtsQ
VNTGKIIRKIVFISIWLTIGSGMVILLAAAMHKQNNDRCKDYRITIKGAKDNLFIDQHDVEKLLMDGTKGEIRNQLLSSFDLGKLEQTLKSNQWISKADLYFDNHDVLHVTVTEKEPVARVFTLGGNSFYIDKGGSRLPLSPMMSARVPVFTGFPDKKILKGNDSILFRQVQDMAVFILNDPFWMAQVSQVDITPERNFEMIPVVGNHIVKLGNGDGIEKKFHRLFVFYKQVLSKTGFEKYRTIDVQYAGQIVASNKTGNPKVDSVQLRKNVEKLLLQSRTVPPDTVTSNEHTEKPTIQPGTVPPATNPNSENAGIKPRDPNPLKSLLTKPAGEKDKPKPEKKTQQPKAVMPKPVVEEHGYQ